MEKAIIKTLVYSDIFDYPLKSYEIHKWLINKKCTLKDLEKPLNKLLKKGVIETQRGFFFLKGRKVLVSKREKREVISSRLLKKALVVSQLLRVIPWIKMVGVSGSLSMKNADKLADIDLFIVTDTKKVWVSRLVILSILSALFTRRRKGDIRHKSAQKICVNTILDRDSLVQNKRNIYIAHEVLQMRVLWQKEDIYKKYLEDNDWAFNFLPNWSSVVSAKSTPQSIQKSISKEKIYKSGFVNNLENLSKILQKSYMGTPKGRERISDNALYFHPEDYNDLVLNKYKTLLKKIVI